VFGSTLLLKVMERYPIIIKLGAALLGWVAGEMFVSDPLVKDWVEANAGYLHWIGPGAGAVAVVAVGTWLAAQVMARRPALAELGAAPPAAVAPVRPAPAGARLFNRILLPVDASDHAARAVAYAVELWRNHPAPQSMDVHVINVQREVSGDVSRFIPKESVDSFHRERSEQALARARKLLDDAGVKYQVHMLVGKPWEVISDFAKKYASDLIVMGTRGLGTYTGGMLGSVAQGVAQLSPVPVLLVK